jgi:hypothetical protein
LEAELAPKEEKSKPKGTELLKLIHCLAGGKDKPVSNEQYEEILANYRGNINHPVVVRAKRNLVFPTHVPLVYPRPEICEEDLVSVSGLCDMVFEETMHASGLSTPASVELNPISTPVSTGLKGGARLILIYPDGRRHYLDYEDHWSLSTIIGKSFIPSSWQFIYRGQRLDVNVPLGTIGLRPYDRIHVVGYLKGGMKRDELEEERSHAPRRRQAQKPKPKGNQTGTNDASEKREEIKAAVSASATAVPVKNEGSCQTESGLLQECELIADGRRTWFTRTTDPYDVVPILEFTERRRWPDLLLGWIIDFLTFPSILFPETWEWFFVYCFPHFLQRIVTRYFWFLRGVVYWLFGAAYYQWDVFIRPGESGTDDDVRPFHQRQDPVKARIHVMSVSAQYTTPFGRTEHPFQGYCEMHGLLATTMPSSIDTVAKLRHEVLAWMAHQPSLRTLNLSPANRARLYPGCEYVMLALLAPSVLVLRENPPRPVQ